MLNQHHNQLERLMYKAMMIFKHNRTCPVSQHSPFCGHNSSFWDSLQLWESQTLKQWSVFTKEEGIGPIVLVCENQYVAAGHIRKVKVSKKEILDHCPAWPQLGSSQKTLGMVGNEYVDGGVMTEEEWGKQAVEKWKMSTLCAMK